MEGPPPKVAILLPLSGQRAEIGQSMLKAAQLALAPPAAPASTAGGAAPATEAPPAGTPVLDARDTFGTPDGAANAARQALAEGAVMILGPLTSGETAAVAPIAHAAHIPVLAFTNDPAQSQPGVWTLGITPQQQVLRVTQAARDQGRARYAALVPDSEFGRAMSGALVQATAALGLPPPAMRQYARGSAAPALRDLSEWDSRGGPVEAQIKALRASGDDASKQQADALEANKNVPPPPFDVLMLADTGQPLGDIAALLPTYGIAQPAVRIAGPALWSAPSSNAAKLPGAWYAAPDPAARVTFDQTYRARYGSPAPSISDLAFDAASIARVMPMLGGFAPGNLTQASGFSGADGVFMLLPDGQVQRGLAVFEVQPGGAATIVSPAPAGFGGPGV